MSALTAERDKATDLVRARAVEKLIHFTGMGQIDDWKVILDVGDLIKRDSDVHEGENGQIERKMLLDDQCCL